MGLLAMNPQFNSLICFGVCLVVTKVNPYINPGYINQEYWKKLDGQFITNVKMFAWYIIGLLPPIQMRLLLGSRDLKQTYNTGAATLGAITAIVASFKTAARIGE